MRSTQAHPFKIALVLSLLLAGCDGDAPPVVDDDAGPGRVGRDAGSVQRQCDASEGPRCDGDTLVECRSVSGNNTEFRTTCIDGCEAGACVEAMRPSSVSGSGSLVDTDPVSTGGIVVLTVSGDITYSPALPAALRLRPDDSPTYRITSPDVAGCTISNASFSLGTGAGRPVESQNILATFSGDLGCMIPFQSMSDDGLTVEIDDVPYEEGGGEADLTVSLN